MRHAVCGARAGTTPPALLSPATRSVHGPLGGSPEVARAYPSIALLSNGGRGEGATRATARTRPAPSDTGIRSNDRGRTCASSRARASSNGSRFDDSVAMLLPPCERDRVNEDRCQDAIHCEHDRLGTPGQRRHDATAVDSGDRAREHRVRPDLIPGETTERLAEAIERLV